MAEGAVMRAHGIRPGEAIIRAWLEHRPADAPAVVNRHHFTKPWPEQCNYVGRPTPLCNPFPHQMTKRQFFDIALARGWPESSREAWAKAVFQSDMQERPVWVLKLYRADLDLQMRRGGEVKDALLTTPASAALMCSCASSPDESRSKPCHAFIAVRAWRWLKKEGERNA